MTPKHQQVIDAALRQAYAHVVRLQQALGLDVSAELAEEETLLTQLRASPLGVRLEQIALYVEGYPPAVEPERKRVWGRSWQEEEITGGMREVVHQVCAVLYRSRGAAHGWRSPDHQTEMGKLLHGALLQFYRAYLPPEQLVSVAEAAKEVGIGRQTLHEWMKRGKATWIYDAGADVIWLDRDEVSRLWGEKLGLSRSQR